MGVVAGRRGYSWLRSVGRGRWPRPAPGTAARGHRAGGVRHSRAGRRARAHRAAAACGVGAACRSPPGPSCCPLLLPGGVDAVFARSPTATRRCATTLLRPRPPPSSSPPPTPGTVQAQYECSRLGWSTPAVRGARLRRGHPNPVPDGQAGTAGVPAALRLPTSPASSTAPPQQRSPRGRSWAGSIWPRCSARARGTLSSRVCRQTAESRPAGVVAECVEQVGQGVLDAVLP